MLNGFLLCWFILTGLSLIYLVYDLATNTPTVGIMKAAWFLVILYTGPLGLFIYFVSCRQPLPDTHDEFIKPLWKQAIGSEVHCLAGDATGIIVAAIILSFFPISTIFEMIIEYFAGFFFGWLVFQALFMKNMMGGNYFNALKSTFISEWLSMNCIMAGMIPAMVIWRQFDAAATQPNTLSFWGSMALASIIGYIIAYPMNYWLVKNGLKHGMMTAPKPGVSHGMDHSEHSMQMPNVSGVKVFLMTVLSVIVLGAGIFVAAIA